MGFCLFNNVAIAAELAIRELGLSRVFILDWDVHHGNGTCETFRDRSDVLFASIHESGSFPGTGRVGDTGAGAGEGYTINLPVPRGSDGDLWLSLLDDVILPAASAFEPQLVLISAGYDAHEGDPLTGCRLQTSSFADMARHVGEFAASADVSVGAVLEGGYQPETLAECVRETMIALAGDEPPTSVAPERLLTSRKATEIARR
jgi:acetoin utilization deacetylase AcuC-like enzyme